MHEKSIGDNALLEPERLFRVGYHPRAGHGLQNLVSKWPPKLSRCNAAVNHGRHCVVHNEVDNFDIVGIDAVPFKPHGRHDMSQAPYQCGDFLTFEIFGFLDFRSHDNSVCSIRNFRHADQLHGPSLFRHDWSDFDGSGEYIELSRGHEAESLVGVFKESDFNIQIRSKVLLFDNVPVAKCRPSPEPYMDTFFRPRPGAASGRKRDAQKKDK